MYYMHVLCCDIYLASDGCPTTAPVGPPDQYVSPLWFVVIYRPGFRWEKSLQYSRRWDHVRRPQDGYLQKSIGAVVAVMPVVVVPSSSMIV